MSIPGYYRFPAIHNDTLVFTSEDDLWTVPAGGGIARRLTANLGAITHSFFSPDGGTLAFTGREEGHNEVYVMPAEGGPARRLTYLGANSQVFGWTPDGALILFGSDAAQPRNGILHVHAVSPEGGMPRPWPVGPAASISVTTGNRTVLGRNNNDPARWKRYRGGTAGDLWVDAAGNGEFRRLIRLNGNLARPMWLGDRIFFLSDHEGFGNLYSCAPDGSGLRRHTHRADAYARFPNADGKRIAYQAGADLYIYDPQADRETKVEIAYHSPRVQRQRKFVDAAKYLEDYDLHPKGHSLAVNARGKSVTFGNWEGAVTQQGGDGSPTRRQRTRWLNDGRRTITVTDAGGELTLEVHGPGAESVLLEGLDIGQPYELLAAPVGDQILISNHRNELLCADVKERTLTVADRSDFGFMRGMAWSPDGRWAAYGFPTSPYTTALKLWDKTTGESRFITEPMLHDARPAFDPEGKYLYFIGARTLNPVYDNLHFDLGFPKGEKPYLITLRADLPSPFVPKPRGLEEGKEPEPKAEEPTPEEEATGEAPGKPVEALPKPVEIDLEGIANRIVAFPVPEGRYGSIAGIKGKALFLSFPVQGALDQEDDWDDAPAKGALHVYDFAELKQETLLTGIADFALSQEGKTLAVRAGDRLRVLKAGEKPDEKAGDKPGRKSGWIDLKRVRLSIEPGVEWRQMAREAWRLQREFFWTPDMSQVDWSGVWERYAPLVERVGTRGEFSDLMWEMQGELGTSHAYEFGGDYRQEPKYPVGFLGADFAWDEAAGAYRIARIVQGTPGEEEAFSPLMAPGANVKAGELLKAINGRPLTQNALPQELLVHQAGQEVTLTVEDSAGKARDVTVKTLKSEFPARYREWVENNRRLVHERTGGRIGYVHLPDMGANGYAEFHRLFLAEVARDGLIVDVRYNRGGHVSQLLIEKLARKRVGYDIARWNQPEPYPNFSVGGPMVALTNQNAGSDGDIFSHVFKLLDLGPLIGTRTWGGVVGIWPRNRLADGSLTTQPEFSFWFQDVGWGVENYGTDPDIEVEIAPQDFAQGRDPQMERALEMILERLEAEPPVKPDFSARPNLAPPALAPFPGENGER